MVSTTRGGRRGFFIPGQIGLIIEAAILVTFLGLFIFGGALAGDAVTEFLQSAAETNLEAFRDEVEYGCRAGERTGDPVSEDYEFKETIVEVRMVDGGARYEATLDDGSTISVENDGCDAVYICSGSVSVDCTEGTLSGGFVQMELLFQDTGGGTDPDVLWIGQTNREGSSGGGTDFVCSGSKSYNCGDFSDDERGCRAMPECGWRTFQGGGTACETVQDVSCSDVTDITSTPGANPEEICRAMGCTVDSGTFSQGACTGGDATVSCNDWGSDQHNCNAVPGCYWDSRGPVCAQQQDAGGVQCSDVGDLAPAPDVNPEAICGALSCTWDEAPEGEQRCDNAGGFCTTGSECQNFGGSGLDASCDYSTHSYCCNVE